MWCVMVSGVTTGTIHIPVSLAPAHTHPPAHGTQSGSIPDTFIDYLAINNTVTDLRLNYMCCCAIGKLAQQFHFWNVR